MPFKVEQGEKSYRIIGPQGQEGCNVPWEEIATLKIGKELYYCQGDCDSDDNKVECVVTSKYEDTDCEDVIFDGEDGDDPDDGEEVEEIEDDEEEDEEEESRVA